MPVRVAVRAVQYPVSSVLVTPELSDSQSGPLTLAAKGRAALYEGDLLTLDLKLNAHLVANVLRHSTLAVRAEDRIDVSPFELRENHDSSTVRLTPRSAASLHSSRGSAAASCCSPASYSYAPRSFLVRPPRASFLPRGSQS